MAKVAEKEIKVQKEIDFVKKVQKRDGTFVSFDVTRITDAIHKAMIATGEGSEREAELVGNKVYADLIRIARRYRNFVPTVEGIQDNVEKELILNDYVHTAKAYILYREERARLRTQGIVVPEHLRKLTEESKKYFRNALGEFVYYRTYSRWLEKEGRRETWIETVDRYMDFMKENVGEKLKPAEYKELRRAIIAQEVLPSMRLMQFAGSPARKSNVCAYNCSFVAPTKLQDFGEIMYISMCSTGVGFSVESRFIHQLPQIKTQTGKVLPPYTIPDSKEGWADALVFGLKTWFDGKDVSFDYSLLRPAGARLKTMGGRASGPDPLRALLDFSRGKVLGRQGRRLTNLDAHDIITKIGEIVVAGGVRRSALISLSDLDDQEMRDSKRGQFYLTEPQRSLANNSAVYESKPSVTEFMDEWVALMKSGTGERGIFNRGSLTAMLPERRLKALKGDVSALGTNPCVTGDTLVYVADGRGHVPIKELAQEGKDIPVFCLNERGGIAVRYMRHPRVTRARAEVYTITLDDGSVIKATPNHAFRLKDGEYREVQALKQGDSLAILTKFEASVKDIFPKSNANSQNYWWVNNGLTANKAEHRPIAEFHYNTQVPRGYIVHHKDRNGENNSPKNLEIMSKGDHDELHGVLMRGDSNPMRRAAYEWSAEKWSVYRGKHSENNTGENNKNFSGVTDEELKEHALKLTRFWGRRFSNVDWVAYAKEHNVPQFFSTWRRNHLGDVMGLAKWAAHELGFEHIDADPRVLKSYGRYTSEGYDCEVVEGALQIIKCCEVCQGVFRTSITTRECGVCSLSCGITRHWQDAEKRQQRIESIHAGHEVKKGNLREQQVRVYSDLKFALGRNPLKKEWRQACEQKDISFEISRVSSPVRTYGELEELSTLYNHKVVSVVFAGHEDVYNGTVDEFHNFFVGGFEGKTKNQKRKFVFINNRQCGEINLQSKQFCNLSEVVARAEDTEKSLLRKVRVATILGTYQSMLTNLGYLSKKWEEHCKQERLLGVSITGQWDCPAVRNGDTLEKMKKEAVHTNQLYAKRLGIGESTSVTCVKPSGNGSQTVDCSSGLHPRYAPFYIRRIRISATDPLFKMLRDQGVPYHPEVGQSPETASTYVLDFPVKAPEGSVYKDDLSALQQLEYWKMLKEHFTEHNPSATIYIGESEWIEAANWVYTNWDIIGGLSFLPRSNHVYQLAPYQEITEDEYTEQSKRFDNIDFAKIVTYEMRDEIEQRGELACAGGVCEI